MKKLYEVREFEIITCNKDYEDDNTYKYLPENIFDDFEKFILSSQSRQEAEVDAIDFVRISARRNVGKVIQAKNYVGLIQLKSGYQIQVLPKISFNEDDTENCKTKKVFLRMLRSMKDFPSKAFNDANLKTDHMNLYEIFINMYIQEVRELTKSGIKSAYLREEDNLSLIHI